MACIGGYCRDGQRRFHQRGSCSYSNGTVCLRRLVDRVSKTDFELTRVHHRKVVPRVTLRNGKRTFENTQSLSQSEPDLVTPQSRTLHATPHLESVQIRWIPLMLGSVIPQHLVHQVKPLKYQCLCLHI